MKTKQIVFTRPGVAELLDVECPSPGENQVTVELAYSAISSGTEKAMCGGLRVGSNIDTFPRTAGYSATGVVVDVGAAVRDVAVGDKVVVFWGSHQKRVTVDSKNVVKIPDGVSLQEATVAFIATFPLAAIRKTKCEIGESAMVMGLGILGLFAVQELKAAGAYPVVAVDPIATRRELALKLGADVALDPTDADFVRNACEATEGGVNVCIEVTGLGAGLIQALECMKPMGRVALLGCTRDSHFEIDYYDKVHRPGVTLIGAHTAARPQIESAPGLWTEADDIKALLNLVKGKRMDFKEMISEINSPADAPRVYERLLNEKNFPVGVLFDWSLI